ncbi:hypothetical protein DA718_10075 [Klebsiella huaxiensis]|uniref:Fimbrial protein n=3 Tax=Klebsiella huaxiensis TaxID=2153354 RepID=A0ABT6EGF4_9ENTR|nr:fimbrial protein [Klebsiella huaxiensis]MDG1644255.1 fimbrial protein [Klebsiella huaxiensis]QBG07522.1 hypothetical protein DA718_10075 [Klebsiella huaxiensis]VUS84876.1 hypothetical protein SB6421_03872 [Klebsiella huaxiensis]
MKRLTTLACLCVFPAASVYAVTYSATAVWSNGALIGQTAAWCSVTLPDERPMTIPRSFVVGNDVPNGTEIYSWGYGAAFSDFIVSCTSNGSAAWGLDTDSAPLNRIILTYNSGGYIPLSDTGFGLKIWGRFNTAGQADYTACGGVSTLCKYYTNYYTAPTYQDMLGANTEIDFTVAGYSSNGMSQQITKYRRPSDGYNTYPTITGSMSIRMALVKIGTIQYNGALKVNNSAVFRVTANINAGIQNTLNGFLDGSGITIIPPACQLKNTDYTLPMGRWAADVINYTGAPAYGAQVPVNLSLECSGKVNHVRFRFEDTGTSLSSNKNISLYDTAGGSKIEGLEIEMLYNGSKVNVDNTTITDTGSHGAFVSLTPAFDSFGTAAFHARYVQNAAVTRSGANYTGPVTGKVNMYVTYD